MQATLRVPASGAWGLVLLLHGFKGFRDWGFFPFLGERLAEAGLASATPDFSHNGIGAQRGVLDRLDLFEQNALSTEIEDVEALHDRIRADPRLRHLPLALVGHSRGGAVALLAADRMPDVRAVVGLATVADFKIRFSAEDWKSARTTGRVAVRNTRTGQVLHVGRKLLEEMRDRSGRFDPIRAATRVQAPVLLLHGKEDEAVSPAESRRIELARARTGLPTEVRLLEGTGHTLGAVHPFAGSTQSLATAIEATIRFLRKALATDSPTATPTSSDAARP